MSREQEFINLKKALERFKRANPFVAPPRNKETPTQFRGCSLGLYKIFWKSGGVSAAAVGFDYYGDRWFMPTNWTDGPCFDWSKVKSIELITTQGEL